MFVDPSGYLNVGYDANGVWHDWDAEQFGYDSAKYKMLEALTTAYNNAYSDEDRKRIGNLADKLRRTNTTIVDAILINNSQGANGFGHNGVVLLNSAGEGLFFSYYPESGSALYDNGEMRFSVLSVEEVAELKDRNGTVNEAVTIKGNRRWENGEASYDRFVWSDVLPSEGEKMLKKAIEIFKNPGDYEITGNQCDNVASQVLNAGGHGYTIYAWPNTSYHNYKTNRIHWINQTGKRRSVSP